MYKSGNPLHTVQTLFSPLFLNSIFLGECIKLQRQKGDLHNPPPFLPRYCTTGEETESRYLQVLQVQSIQKTWPGVVVPGSGSSALWLGGVAGWGLQHPLLYTNIHTPTHRCGKCFWSRAALACWEFWLKMLSRETQTCSSAYVGAFIGIWGGVYFSTPLSPPSLCVKIFTLRFITQKIKQKKRVIYIYMSGWMWKPRWKKLSVQKVKNINLPHGMVTFYMRKLIASAWILPVSYSNSLSIAIN